MGENKVATILNQPRTNPAPAPSQAPPGGGSTSGAPPASGGGSGHEVEWIAPSIKKLGHAFETEVGEIFRQARNKLNVKPRDAQPAAFTTFGISCALVYTQLIEFADQDLISKTENLKEINDKLQKTAATKEEADRKSVIKEI
ncbi:hypothetical protein ACQP1W_49745 [Spirillospora sp. CA-255316]